MRYVVVSDAFFEMLTMSRAVVLPRASSMLYV